MNVKKHVMLSVLLGTLLLFLSGCEKKENPFPDHVGGQIFQGLKKVNVNCADCHGSLGGGGMRAPSLTESVKKLSPEQFVTIVTNGGSGTMPAFEKVLEEEEILQIVDWLTKLPD